MHAIAADRDRLKQLVQALPPTRRLIVVLHCYERLTWAEIGEVLGLPAARVQAVYESIVKTFKRQLA